MRVSECMKHARPGHAAQGQPDKRTRAHRTHIQITHAFSSVPVHLPHPPPHTLTHTHTPVPAGSTAANFNSDLEDDFNKVVANITGQPLNWVLNTTATTSSSVSTKSASSGPLATEPVAKGRRLQQGQAATATPIDISTFVASNNPQSTQSTLADSVEDGTMQQQLDPLGLQLVKGSASFNIVSPRKGFPKGFGRQVEGDLGMGCIRGGPVLSAGRQTLRL